jgi:hypothetical protein
MRGELYTILFDRGTSTPRTPTGIVSKVAVKLEEEKRREEKRREERNFGRIHGVFARDG